VQSMRSVRQGDVGGATSAGACLPGVELFLLSLLCLSLMCRIASWVEESLR
jgi:hypothetical protein